MTMTDRQKGFLMFLILGAGMAAAVIALNWGQDYSWSHRLCDGFFTAAVLLLGFGGLKYARNKGTFDVMSYGMISAFHLHFPGAKGIRGEEDFVTYRERKQAERKSPAEILMAGLVYLVLAFLMLLVYELTA